MGDKKVIVYSTPTCPWCNKVKQYLKGISVDYEEKNVAQDIKAREEMVETSGQLGVPVIVIGETIIVGFDKEEIDDALKDK